MKNSKALLRVYNNSEQQVMKVCYEIIKKKLLLIGSAMLRSHTKQMKAKCSMMFILINSNPINQTLSMQAGLCIIQSQHRSQTWSGSQGNCLKWKRLRLDATSDMSGKLDLKQVQESTTKTRECCSLNVNRMRSLLTKDLLMRLMVSQTIFRDRFIQSKMKVWRRRSWDRKMIGWSNSKLNWMLKQVVTKS